MTAIKTEAERARLDELYALVEAEMDHSAGSGETPEKAEAGKGQEPFDNTRSDEGVLRFKNSFPDNPPKDVAVNVRCFIHNGLLVGRREKYLAAHYLKLYEDVLRGVMGEKREIRCELNRLSNFAMAVIQRLENCERAAREQDNHHYYKIFADSVRKLAAKLQGVADVEN